MGWEYATVSLDADGGGRWSGWLIIGGREPSPVATTRDRERVALFDSLGREGWEMVSQAAHGTANGPTRSYVYGWEWTFKRPI